MSVTTSASAGGTTKHLLWSSFANWMTFVFNFVITLSLGFLALIVRLFCLVVRCFSREEKARVARFKAVMKKFPPTNTFYGPPGIPYGSFDDIEEAMDDGYGNYYLLPVIAEITAPWFHPFRYAIQVTDIEGKTFLMVFYCDEKVFIKKPPGGRKGKRKGKGKTGSKAIPMEECVKPGNYVVLKDPMWHYFLDGNVGFRIEDLDDVDFIFP